MGILVKIWLGLSSRMEQAARDERGEVIPWVVLAIGIVGITAAVIALLRPAVLNAAQQIISSM
ncbi:MAG TPA: hypothetical protein VK701_07665 [Solirubrobacteraceae bacterium]|jgi:hypothetical protein|nr:hypothetical protein [Solirubrobacteraceae bacterium]